MKCVCILLSVLAIFTLSIYVNLLVLDELLKVLCVPM
jgi:hypothetical protein